MPKPNMVQNMFTGITASTLFILIIIYINAHFVCFKKQKTEHCENHDFVSPSSFELQDKAIFGKQRHFGRFL